MVGGRGYGESELHVEDFWDYDGLIPSRLAMTTSWQIYSTIFSKTNREEERRLLGSVDCDWLLLRSWWGLNILIIC